MSSSSRVYYCTCQIKHRHSITKKMTETRHLKFHRTEVDEDECCVHCGYYAWEAPQHTLYPRRTIVPWRNEVCDRSGWAGYPELRDAYFNKTMFSDYEIDNGTAYNEHPGTKALGNKSTQDELRDCYVRWGGNDREG